MSIATRQRWVAAGLVVIALGVAAAGHRAPVRLPSRPARAGPAPGAGGAAVLLFGGRLDLNLASVRDLTALPGVGPGRARAIVLGRPYRSVAGLARVPGIGPTLARRLGRHVMVLAPGGAPAIHPSP